jgi:hypothetical protein
VVVQAATNAAGYVYEVVADMFGSTPPVEFELDIATGASGSEAVIATVRGVCNGSTTSSPANPIRLPVPVAYASGAQLNARMRASGTSASLNVALMVAE